MPLAEEPRVRSSSSCETPNFRRFLCCFGLRRCGRPMQSIRKSRARYVTLMRKTGTLCIVMKLVKRTCSQLMVGTRQSRPMSSPRYCIFKFEQKLAEKTLKQNATCLCCDYVCNFIPKRDCHDLNNATKWYSISLIM